MPNPLKSFTNPAEAGAPLASALRPVDPYWCIETNWAMNAKRALDGINFGAHMADVEAVTPYDPTNADIASDQKPYAVNDDGIACLYLTGPMTKRPTSMSFLFGGTSTIRVRRQVRLAAADPDVKAIAIIIDSPGGQVAGTADLGQDITEARKSKPVGAYIEDCGCSAAYWIACCCDFIYLNPDGITGSIGTVLVVEDTSKAYDEAGIKVHVISTGDYKGAGADGTEITDDIIADFQRVCDELNAGFLQTVSTGRNMPMDKVRKIADGRVHVGPQAKQHGLVDKLATIDQFYAKLGGTDDFDDDDVDPDSDDDDANDLGAPLDDSTPSTPPVNAAAKAAGTTAAIDRGPEKGPVPMVDKPGLFARIKTGIAAVRGGDVSDDDVAEAIVASSAMAPAATPIVAAAELKPAQPQISAEDKAMLDAVKAAGIKSPAELKATVDLAKHGETYVADIRKDAKAHAVRALGATDGAAQAAAIDLMPIEVVAGLAKSWSSIADAKAGIDKHGNGPGRTSAPAAVSVSAENGDEAAAQRPWDRLTAEQQDYLTKLGAKTTAKQDAMALSFLEQKGAN